MTIHADFDPDATPARKLSRPGLIISAIMLAGVVVMLGVAVLRGLVEPRGWER